MRRLILPFFGLLCAAPLARAQSRHGEAADRDHRDRQHQLRGRHRHRPRQCRHPRRRHRYLRRFGHLQPQDARHRGRRPCPDLSRRPASSSAIAPFTTPRRRRFRRSTSGPTSLPISSAAKMSPPSPRTRFSSRKAPSRPTIRRSPISGSSAKTVRVYENDRVIFQNVTFYVRNVPIFWWPYMYQSLDDSFSYMVSPAYLSSWGPSILGRSPFRSRTTSSCRSGSITGRAAASLRVRPGHSLRAEQEELGQDPHLFPERRESRYQSHSEVRADIPEGSLSRFASRAGRISPRTSTASPTSRN